MTTDRTPPKKKAKELAKLLRTERPDYPYLKSVFRALRAELEISIPRKEERLPEVPTEEDIRRFYQAVWNCRNFADMVLIKTLFYTGVRVSELVAIRLDAVDVERCQNSHHTREREQRPIGSLSSPVSRTARAPYGTNAYKGSGISI